ncbi:hypothetical protein C8R45DRAFT_1065863 [Mycena sanguinolenta]|nr:hypothetical protein C8R45DRAFT_1065863 [Mycena sanguinolenta]
MSSPPAKRKRTEDSQSQITRSDHLWISDGNVVLQAGNTQFRVHFGLLARHSSSIFRGMKGPSELPEQPSVEGCPVLELSDDPEDLEYLLQALYDPLFHSQQTLPLPAVRALIRLGSKYNYKGLRDSAVARVMAQCPTTLEGYDRPGAAVQWYDGFEFDMATLEESFVGIPKRGGTHIRDGTRASLSPVDLQRCAIGRQKLLVKQFEPGYTFGWARKWEFTDCTSPVVCGNLRDDVWRNQMGDCLISALHQPVWLSTSEFCAACIRHAKESMTAGRKKIWRELPKIFGLSSWSQLKNDL